MMHTRSGRFAAAFLGALALASIQGTAATAQYEKGCKYYSVSSCAGDKWQELGYSSRGECNQAKYIECVNGGPLDVALQFKPEATLLARAPAART